jgi:hypothetical protein
MVQMTGQTSGGVSGETTARTIGRPSGLTSGGEEWIAAAEAARRLHVSLRTMRRWIASGRVMGRIEGEPGHETRFVRADTLPPLSGEVIDTQPGRTDGRCDVRADDRPGPGPDIRGDVRGDRPDTCPCCQIRAEEVQHLRAQIDLRSHAEAELRVMLVRLERTNAELAGALVQKALPPAVEVKETPRRVRWWSWWRNGT